MKQSYRRRYLAFCPQYRSVDGWWRVVKSERVATREWERPGGADGLMLIVDVTGSRPRNAKRLVGVSC